jgi:hypothetical protein
MSFLLCPKPKFQGITAALSARAIGVLLFTQVKAELHGSGVLVVQAVPQRA